MANCTKLREAANFNVSRQGINILWYFYEVPGSPPINRAKTYIPLKNWASPPSSRVFLIEMKNNQLRRKTNTKRGWLTVTCPWHMLNFRIITAQPVQIYHHILHKLQFPSYSSTKNQKIGQKSKFWAFLHIIGHISHYYAIQLGN